MVDFCIIVLAGITQIFKTLDSLEVIHQLVYYHISLNNLKSSF